MSKKLFYFVTLLIPLWVLWGFQVLGDPEIDDAHQWFDTNYPKPEFRGQKTTLNWLAARKVKSPTGVLYVEVPLNELIEFNIGDLNDAPIDASNHKENGRVSVVIENGGGGAYNATFLRTSATNKFLDSYGKAAVFATTFDQIQPTFSGELEYFKMDSRSYKGVMIRNGNLIGEVRAYDPDLTASSTDRCVYCFNQAVTSWVTVSIGGQSPSTGPPETSLFRRCEFSDCYELAPLPDAYIAGLNGYYGQFWSNLYNSSVPPVQTPPPPPINCIVGDEWQIQFPDTEVRCGPNTYKTEILGTLHDKCLGNCNFDVEFAENATGCTTMYVTSHVILQIQEPITKSWVIASRHTIHAVNGVNYESYLLPDFLSWTFKYQ